jgi:hypothetical protein
MKKLTAIVLSVILIATGVLCITTNAMDEHFANYSADWYAYAGSVLWNQGNSDTIVRENPQTYEIHAGAPAADIVGFYGWAALKEGKIKTFGIKLDGGEMIDSPLSRLQDAALDRTAELEGAGIVNGEGFWLVFYYTDLGIGTHNAAFYAIGENDEAYEIFNYDFTVIEKYPDQWLCDSTATASVAPGLWCYPFVEGATCSLTFDAVNPFAGICIMMYANPDGADVEVSLLDKDGKELEKLSRTQKGDDAPTLVFSKSYDAGTYTIKFTTVSNATADGWFVIGTADPSSTDVAVSGEFTTNENTRAGILAFLVGAVKTDNGSTSEPSDPGEPSAPATNPDTADAAVIAIAAVACIALAGVVIAKKVK